jgi:hypothetical protein
VIDAIIQSSSSGRAMATATFWSPVTIGRAWRWSALIALMNPARKTIPG